MQSRTYSPNPLGWIETELDRSHIDFLWKRIEESDGKSMKDNLIGNISKSFIIEDRADFFFKKVLLPHVQKYRRDFNGDPIRNHVFGNVEMVLNGFWANYQYQHEFNPYHHHGGVYSFAIWTINIDFFGRIVNSFFSTLIGFSLCGHLYSNETVKLD